MSDEILSALATLIADDPSLNAGLERLRPALRPVGDFREIAEVLPPKARYLGPGAWLDALGASRKE